MTRNFRVRKNGAMPILVSLPFRAAIPERPRGNDRIEHLFAPAIGSLLLRSELMAIFDRTEYRCEISICP
jgi:hypothetical protein